MFFDSRPFCNDTLQKTDIAVQRHEGKISWAIIINDTSIFVSKCTKTENICNRLVVHIRDDGWLGLVILVVGDEARYELPVCAWGWRWAREG
jgi:hypothetical protein